MFRSKVSMFLAAVLTVTGLVGCSSSTQEPAKETAKPAEKQQAPPAQAPEKPKGSKFVFWDKSEYVKDYNELQKARVEKFGKDNNIEVEYVIVPPNDLKTKLLASIEAKNPPDLVVTDDFLAKQFSGMDQLVDVTDLMSQIKFTDAALKMAHVKAGNFMVPQAFLAPGLYLRKDKWDASGLKLPETWQDLKDAGAKVNDPKNNFYTVGLPMGASGGGDAEGMMRSIILSYGGVPVDENGNITINSPQTLEAMKVMASIFKDKLTPPSSVTWDDTGNNNAYLSGSVGVIMNSASVFSTMKTDKPDLLAKTVILPYPAGPKGRFIPGGGNVFVIFKNGKNTDAAKKFVTDFFQKDYYGPLIEKINGMWQPTVQGMDDTDFWKKPENKGWLDNSKSIIPVTYPAEADDKGTKAMSEQLIVKAMQKIIVNNTDPQKALNELEADFKKIYAK